jgi:hypothetical protein
MSMIASLALTSCCTVAHPCARGVPRELIPQITEAMRRAGYPSITFYDHLYHDPPGTYLVHTVEGYQFKVWRERGKWKVKEYVVVTG